MKDILPRGLDARIEEIQGKHQQAIKEKDNQIQALEFSSEAHQQKIFGLNEEIEDLIATRHVARHRSFDNVLCSIINKSGEVHPYYVIRCQYKQLEKHKR